ncbi:hypothetical protein KC845_03820 [Candidatus Kaiserbacteria bacterium]|nr:hypothetical protein [Candidatus Kaiserbacteria bacterium]
MKNFNRREFLGGAAAGGFALFASKLEAQDIERGPEDILNDIEALKTSLSGLEEEISALGVAYGDHFKNDTLDQLDEEAKQRFTSFLERAEIEWEKALTLFSQIQDLTQGTTITEYEQYGLSDHPNAQVLRSFSKLKPTLLGLLPLRMNIAREALGKEIVEYDLPF